MALTQTIFINCHTLMAERFAPLLFIINYGWLAIVCTQDIKDQLYTFNIGVEGNVGFNYHFGHSNIFIEGVGNYGFLNIQKGTQNGKNNTGAATTN